MAKSKAEIQQEYNEALKVSQSLTGALNKMIDNTEKSQKKVSDEKFIDLPRFNGRLFCFCPDRQLLYKSCLHKRFSNLYNGIRSCVGL